MTALGDSPARRWPRRYTVVALCFAATFLCYIDRVNISVAVIPMAKELGWDTRTQGFVLSAFFAGYLLTQILGGRLADRFGGKRVLGAGVLLWSLFTVLTPPAASLGLGALLASRIGMGLGEGVSFPSIHSLVARWVPVRERTRAVGLNASGIPLGSVFALVVTPPIALHFGWPWVFYLFGAAGLVWFAAWQRHAAASPELHPGVRPEELLDIRGDRGAPTTPPAPPLRVFLSSSAVWAIVVAHFCNNWGGYVMLSWAPTYLTTQLGVDFAAVGLYAMAPSVIAFGLLNVCGGLADRLIARGVPTVIVRKAMQTIGFAGPALALIVVSQVESAALAVGVLCVSSALGAFTAAGFFTNHLDIAPRHAGAVMGLSNTAGTLPGVIGVYTSGWIVATTGSWPLVFYLAAGIYVAGLLFYLVFARGEKLFD